jgi:hypothetical protein
MARGGGIASNGAAAWPRTAISGMNTETFGKTLLELYRLARTVPMQDFQRLALDAIGARFEFDTAWWGMGSRMEGQDVEIHASLPYRLPASYPALWEAIKHEDTIADAVVTAPGTTVNFGRKQLYASPGLASLMARFGITGCLCTVTMLPELNLMAFVSLYRVEGKVPFSENERRYMQLLMPHLTAGLTSNWMLHLERTRATRLATSGTANARRWPWWTGAACSMWPTRACRSWCGANGRTGPGRCCRPRCWRHSGKAPSIAARVCLCGSMRLATCGSSTCGRSPMPAGCRRARPRLRATSRPARATRRSPRS